MSGLLGVIRAHLPKDRYDNDGHNLGTYCTAGDWEGDYFADGEAGPFDNHLADVVLAWLTALLDDPATVKAVGLRDTCEHEVDDRSWHCVTCDLAVIRERAEETR